MPKFFNYTGDVIGARADETPDKVALIGVEPDGLAVSRYTFADLAELAHRTATYSVTTASARETGLTVEIQDHVKAITAPYKYPREITYLTELPKTIFGKIRRIDLRDMV